MRRLWVLLAVVALVAAGCGGGGEKSAADATAQALSYVPANAPAVAVVSTDLDHGAGARVKELANRFLGSDVALATVSDMLERRVGVSLGALAPLAGNDLVLYVDPAAPRATRKRPPVPSIAWVARDAKRLASVAGRARGLTRAGSRDGAAFYTGPRGSAVAIDGPVLVAGPSAAVVRAALDRHGAKRGALTPALFDSRMRALPTKGALLRAAGDARALATRHDAGLARVPYIAHLRRFAATITPGADGIRARLKVATDPRGLKATDLPLAPGVQPPAPRGRAAVVASVRDPAQTLAFARAALAAAGLGPFDEIADALRQFARIDIDKDILAQLTGTATLTTDDLKHITLRAEAADPRRIADALGAIAKLAKLGPLAGLAGIDLHGLDVDERDGRYVIKQDGKTLAVAGVTRNVLVVSTDPAVDFDAVANAAPPARLTPAQGAFRATVDTRAVAARLLDRLGLPPAARLALAPLGTLTATAHAERDGIDAAAFLPISR